MIRTTKQLQANLKDGYKIRNYGYRVTGTETCIVDPTGKKVAWKLGTVASLVKQAKEKGLLK